MDDIEILKTIMITAEKLNKHDIAYIHLCEAEWDDAPQISSIFRKDLCKNFLNTIVATENKTPEETLKLFNENLVALVIFGRKFLSNPDYPERFKQGFSLNIISDNHTLFGGGAEKGYTDYPFYKK